MAGTGVFPLSESEISTTINELIEMVTELKTAVETLRADFKAHDHGNTASYAQEAITIRATPATVTGTENYVAMSCTPPADLGVAPV